MVAKFLKADLLERKQNRKNRKGETGAFLKCKAKQRRAEEQKNQSEQKGIKKGMRITRGQGSVIN
jgi:hypothetical protein